MNGISYICAVFATVLGLALPTPVSANGAGSVTIIYDAFGAPSALQRDWGFAALVEYDGKRILFDTGNNAKLFEANVKELGIDLTKLDAAVISHRHGDHTSGLSYVLSVNAAVKIYVPKEAGFFGGHLPKGFLTADHSLPLDLRYFEGRPPEDVRTGTPWEGGHFETITETTEVLPGFYVLTVRSQKLGTIEMNELALAVRTSKGLAVVVGCSHPGVEKILEKATEIDRQLYMALGGFHLVLVPKDEVERTVVTLHDVLKVERIAPAHCTSEQGLSAFLERFKERFDRAGVGAVISLP